MVNRMDYGNITLIPFKAEDLFPNLQNEADYCPFFNRLSDGLL
jgi:hypothetical protein